jgi:CHAD domain-containing protein
MALTPNPAVCTYGAEVMQRSLSAFRKEIPGVLDSRNIECVHRCRVASRRIATALVIFQVCHPAKRIKVWQKDINRATRILGKARDLDIQADGVRTFIKGIIPTDQRPGVKRLLLRLRQKRVGVQVELLSMLKRLEKSQALESLDVKCRELIFKNQQVLSFQLERRLQFAGETILPVLDDFLSYEPFVYRVDAVNELHAMRIAAKKLRYTLECFSAIYPDELADYLLVMRMLQDHLGVIHDCDLWHFTSSRIIEKERLRTEKYFGNDLAMKRLMPGFMAFFDNRHQQRIETYQVFTAYWHELKQIDIWEKLRFHVASINHAGHVHHLETSE